MQLLNKDSIVYHHIYGCCVYARSRIEGLCDASRKLDSVDDYNHQFFYAPLFSPLRMCFSFVFIPFHFIHIRMNKTEVNGFNTPKTHTIHNIPIFILNQLIVVSH